MNHKLSEPEHFSDLSHSLLRKMRRTFITAHRLLKDASHSGADSQKVSNTLAG